MDDFPTVTKCMWVENSWMDGRTHGRTDGWMDRQMDGWTDEHKDGQMDATYMYMYMYMYMHCINTSIIA